MKLSEVARASLRGITANKVRSLLTLLGVLIGVGAVILLTGVGNGTAESVKSNISSLGTNTISVSVSQSGSSVRSQVLDAGAVTALTDSDLAEDVSEVIPVVSTSETVSSSSTSTTATITGSTADYIDASGLEVAQGTGISDYEENSSSKVVVIGSTLATTLFDTTNAVGETLTIGSGTYTVNGVLQSSSGSDSGSTIIMPLSRAQSALTGYGSYDSLLVLAKNADSVDAASSEVESVLNDYLQVDDDDDSPLSISTATQLLSTLSSTTSTLTSMLTAVAAISLLVAGIGVMNIMLVTVTERTREIGVRKALGATRGVILGQFLIEATSLCVLGGLGGVLAAVLLSNFEFFGVKPVIDASSVLLAVSVSVLIGVFFGSYPANRAAKMRPVEALRHD